MTTERNWNPKETAASSTLQRPDVEVHDSWQRLWLSQPRMRWSHHYSYGVKHFSVCHFSFAADAWRFASAVIKLRWCLLLKIHTKRRGLIVNMEHSHKSDDITFNMRRLLGASKTKFRPQLSCARKMKNIIGKQTFEHHAKEIELPTPAGLRVLMTPAIKLAVFWVNASFAVP